MVTLTEVQKIFLDDILYTDYGGLDSYLSLVREQDLHRLITNNEEFYILTPWDLNLNLVELGLRVGHSIHIVDTDYQVLVEFPYKEFFGATEHRIWLNSLPNGKQFFIAIESLQGVRLVLCLCANKMPLYKKEILIKQWVDQIEFNIFTPVNNELYLAYPGGPYKFIVVYSPSRYRESIDIKDVLRDPERIETTKLNSDNLLLLGTEYGFYAIGVVESQFFTRWLQLDNLEGVGAAGYIYQNGVNFLGGNSNLNLSLNLSPNINQSIQDIEDSAKPFSISAELIDAFDYVSEDWAFSLPVDTFTQTHIVWPLTLITATILVEVQEALAFTQSVITNNTISENMNLNSADTLNVIGAAGGGGVSSNINETPIENESITTVTGGGGVGTTLALTAPVNIGITTSITT